jgi:addiction module HigA family antidote
MKLRKRTPAHPGGILRRNYIDQSVVTLCQLADILGLSEEAASEIIGERAAVTPDMALRLSRAFNTSPELWLNMQQYYDLWHAANDSAEWEKVQPIILQDRPLVQV